MKRTVSTLAMLAGLVALVPPAQADSSFSISFGYDSGYSHHSIYREYYSSYHSLPAYCTTLTTEYYCVPGCTLPHVHHYGPSSYYCDPGCTLGHTHHYRTITTTTYCTPGCSLGHIHHFAPGTSIRYYQPARTHITYERYVIPRPSYSTRIIYRSDDYDDIYRRYRYDDYDRHRNRVILNGRVRVDDHTRPERLERYYLDRDRDVHRLRVRDDVSRRELVDQGVLRRVDATRGRLDRSALIRGNTGAIERSVQANRLSRDRVERASRLDRGRISGNRTSPLRSSISIDRGSLNRSSISRGSISSSRASIGSSSRSFSSRGGGGGIDAR